MNFLQPNEPNNTHEFEDMNKLARIRIYANTLGTAKEIADTLLALHKVYNTFNSFYIAKIDPEFANDPRYSGLCLSMDSYFVREHGCSKPMESLVVSRISFNSPGFWEMIGSLNPLIQLREYLNDRHNRKKDKLLWESESAKSILQNQKLKLENDRLELENQKLALENSRYSIEVSLKKLELTREIFNLIEQGEATEVQKRNFINSCIEVFSDLENHIYNERITSAEILDNMSKDKIIHS